MKNIIQKGFLPVTEGHKIYYEEWGNPSAQPIFYLHGGPGAGFHTSNKKLFDPKNHHVIFHDQRGSGRSVPNASTTNNTTQDLIDDINRLADHLGVSKFMLVGGSWGSTLSLLYAIAHPLRVSKMVLWSIYLARKVETDYVNSGYPRYWFPEAWERFISIVPKKDRISGDTIMNYYAKKIHSENTEEAKKFADEWTLWELTLLSLTYTLETSREIVLQQDNLALARIETHYFMNNSFIPENYILMNIHKINQIPLYIIQGRFDMCTPPFGAQALYEAYGLQADLRWTRAGHLRSDLENRKAIKETLRSVKVS